MTFECKDLERALEFTELLPDAREHARNCSSCSRELWLWSEASKQASSLREEWDSPELWPRLRQQLASEAPRKPVRTRSWKAWGAVAAMLLAGAGGIGYYSLRPAPASAVQQANAPDFLTDQALQEVEQAEIAYLKSIDRLSRVAQPRLQGSKSSLTAAYREKLQLLDAEIAELRASIAQNRFNPHLQSELTALYRDKQSTLKEILQRAETN
jgi:hypothetical protein